MSRRSLLLVRAWPWLLALVVLAPVLAPGYVLSYDMVAVPDLALRPDFLGLGSSLPRAVPSDAVVAVLDELVPGSVLQKTVLVSALVAAGAGARRLAPSEDPVAQLVATTVYVWSPLVAERLVIGHWPLLVTYAVLPWIVVASRRVRSGDSGPAPVVLLVAAGSLSAAGGVLVTLFAVICLAGRQRVRQTVLVVLAAAAVNAPWWVAGLLQSAAAVSDPGGVAVFAARGEGGLPVWLTVLTTGGIWNADAVPTSRTGWPAVASLVVLAGLAVLGGRRLLRLHDTMLRPLTVAAAAGVVLALIGPWAPATLEWVVTQVPGGGLLRDGSRALVLAAPLLACLAASGARSVLDLLTHRTVRGTVASFLVLVPIALMPDLAWGVAGRLDPVSFPEEYAEARAALDERVAVTEGSPDVLVLPFTSYRAPGWNARRPTLDPLGRYLTPDYLASDTLVVSGRTVAGEDPRAREVADLLEADAVDGDDAPAQERLASELHGLGVAWVVVDREAQAAVGDAAPSARFPDDWLIHAGPRLLVWELPPEVAGDGAGAGTRDTSDVVMLAVAWVAGISVVAVAVVRAVAARPRSTPAGHRRRLSR